MSNMKYDAITGSGIEVGERVNIPDELIPMTPASRSTRRWPRVLPPGPVPDAEELKKAKGRGLN